MRVHAAGINPVDYKIVGGSLDDRFPVLWPLVPGWDVAGEVVGVGPAVRHLEVGQRVFGYARKDSVGAGTWAEQVAVPARAVAPAPATLAALAELADADKLSAHVQSVYDLEAVNDAVTEAISGKVRGKVVIRVP